MTKLIYLDTCCYNRPFDDQTQERIKIESEAVLQILNRCQAGAWDLLGSDALEFEISKIEDRVRKYKVSRLYSLAKQKVRVDRDVRDGAKEFQSSNFPALDALHIACAEKGKAEVMLTTDDRLIRLSSQVELKVDVKNPCTWIMEVL